MASLSKSLELIRRAKQSHVPVPWCDEFEKMISGMEFQTANAQEMLEYRFAVSKQLLAFNDSSIPDNSTLATLKSRRMSIAKAMIGKMGERVNIEPPFYLTWGCNLFIGEDVYMNREVSIYDNALVTVGDRVLIGPGVCICTGTHEASHLDRQKGSVGSFAHPITIEDDCWIGARATILPGVRIGKGSTIAAGAVVARDIEEYSLAGGVPAKIIKKLKNE